MYDGGKIITGMIIFIALVTFPLWYTAASGQGGYKPEPKAPLAEKKCVESKEYMNAWHMDMLDTWRDEAVRDGNRTYTASDGKEHSKSLSLTCMKCHDDKEKFCDQCHNYIGVSPYCWDCHVEPKGE
ncbi:MAG: hypothetical protein GY847_02855 [Proteobacteria bacterium]|nr:hypothetical protein [Pseudomonadota bacterium]